MVEKKGSTLKFNVFTPTGLGSVEVGDDDVILRVGKTTTVKKGFVDSISEVGKLALSKVAVTFAYYDLFGNREEVSFSMNTADLYSLKKAVGK